MKKISVNKYIHVRLQVEEEKKKIYHIIGIYYELFDIYTLHIEEVGMNKKSNASLIMNYRKRR